jgi:hypothetical protein
MIDPSIATDFGYGSTQRSVISDIREVIGVASLERATPYTMNINAILHEDFGDSMSDPAASANHHGA